MKQSPAERNLELTLDSIRADIHSASAELSRILSETSKTSKQLQHLNEAACAEREIIAAERNSLQERSLALDLREEDMNLWESRKRQEIGVLEDQKREAMKELSRLNSWIAAAIADYEQKQQENARLEAVILEKHTLEKGILALRNEQQDEEAKRNSIRVEIALAHENALQRMAQLTQNADLAEARAFEALARRDAAENERQSIISEKERIRTDLEIYIRRIEGRYTEAFPELRMIL